MNLTGLELRVGRGTLVAVPAVHFRLPFAAAVNALCGDPATRPEAIAVELGPGAVAAVRAWLDDLGVGPERPRRLPCLLGVVRPNRLLHPRMRTRAMALQREHGCDLERLPPDVLERELGFRGLRVLPMSPTDSIIEAVRCAAELAIPLYGVDLEESAEDGAAPPEVGEDPWLAIGDLTGYVDRNARRALAHHDPLIDGRRERVMAARLKSILAVHDRVLFSGGLGHWVRLTALLADPTVRPATVGVAPASPAAGEGWQRIVIHPSLAVQHLELPKVVSHWEVLRRHPRLGRSAWQPPDARWPLALLARVLGWTSSRYFGGEAQSPQGEGVRCQDWADIEGFCQLLTAELALRLQAVPNLGLVLAGAQATLSEDFRKILTEGLMRFPWARPDQANGIGLMDRVEEDGCVMLGGARSMPSVVQGGGSLVADPNLGHWTWPLPPPHQSPDRHPPEHGRTGVFTWRPWERLATALSAQASGLVAQRGLVPDSVPFEGQWLHGLDARRTVRGHARGDEQVFVRDARLAQTTVPRALINAFPVVWIFDREEEPPGGQFDILRTHLPWLRAGASDRAALERLIVEGEDGEDLVDLVLFRARRVTGLGESGISVYETRGWLLLRPQCPSLRQEGAWMVETRTPVRPTYAITVAGELPPEVRRALDLDGGPEAEQSSWQDVLVRLALAFGGPRVTVVAPDGLVLSPWVQAQAHRHGQTIGRVPLSAFPPEQVARCRTIQMVPAEVRGTEARFIYLGHPERVLGESEDRYRELVPEQWRPFLW